MNFDSLEYFSVLARERSFTRAAELLHITQQSLSSHIAGLERELNCPLVVRRIPLELTFAGQTFLRYAEELRRTQHAMQQEFCDISKNQKGELRVGVAFTRGRTVMPRLIAAFQREYPNVEITLVEDSNDALQKLLTDGDIDLAIADFSKVPQEVELRDFYDEHIVLCLSDALVNRCGLDLAAHEAALRARSEQPARLSLCPRPCRGHWRTHRARASAALRRKTHRQGDLGEHRNPAGAVRAGHRRVLQSGKSCPYGAARGADHTSASPAFRERRVVSHPLRLSQALVSMERH